MDSANRKINFVRTKFGKQKKYNYNLRVETHGAYKNIENKLSLTVNLLILISLKYCKHHFFLNANSLAVTHISKFNS